MAYYGSRGDQSYADSAGLRAEGREPGARRKKLAGYLKAANEMRQSYFSADGTREQHHDVEDGPGAFPDAAVVRNGNEEMILFPSYGRTHVKSKQQHVATPGREMTEEEYWQREWSRHEDFNAVVDVDVRGWIYTPPRGPHTRRQRMLIGLARQLSGIPVPTANRSGESTSATPSRDHSPTKQQDEALIALEADNTIRKGQREEQCATRGAFSEQPSKANDNDSLYGDAAPRGRPRSTYASSIASQDSDITPVQKRQSWQQPAKMTQADLATANMHLLTRLKPFMANPLANTPISAFFYNEQASRQQIVYTDASGHFSFRAALDFVPTHVRVLASEKLSATEEVNITPPTGVSLISDIDDTIKHSAISAGAREIFRNAFIRELGDLTIEGVREWYTTLHDMGVKLHYVSNSPWQMYPVLTSYFKLANLPRGSFHLKQYSGMLQGIFEPAAERKKGSLEKIMRDFPDRRFVLVGDSGEADLEVYTEVALDNPGRILGIFIRDVTTSVRTGYFDSYSPGGGSSGKQSRDNTRNHSRHMSGDSLAPSKRISRPQDIQHDDADLKRAIAASLQDMEAEALRARRSINPDTLGPEHALAGRRGSASGRTQPPARPGVRRTISDKPIAASLEEDLIDFSDPLPSKPRCEASRNNVSPATGYGPNGNTNVPRTVTSPAPPPKPAGLRSPPASSQPPSTLDSTAKTPPPRPRKPSSAIKPTDLPQIQTQQPTPNKPSPLSQVTRQDSTKKPPPPLPARRKLKGTIVKAKPMAGTYWQGDAATGQPRSRFSRSGSQPSSPLVRPSAHNKSLEDLSLPSSNFGQSIAPPPVRREGTAYSTSAARKQQNRMSGAWDDDGSQAGSPGDGLSKKEWLWQQRWQKAKNVLERNGVTLRTWRVGSDVADICVRLVEMEMRRIEKEQKEGSNRNLTSGT